MRRHQYRLLLAPLAIILVFLAACAPSNPGRIVVAIADKAADLEGVSQVTLTADAIEVHSTVRGWIPLTDKSVTVDLLSLKELGQVFIAAELALDPGVYNQVRLHARSLRVFKEDGTVHEAVLPSGELKFVRELLVFPNQTLAVTLDFDIEKSLHQTGEGRYIFLPVITLNVTSAASIEWSENNLASIRGATESSEHAMDERGELGPPKTHQVPPDEAVGLDRAGRVVRPDKAEQPPEPGAKEFPLVIYHARYDPNTFEANRGDTVRFSMVAARGTGPESGFNHMHGIAIDEYGVNEVATSEETPEVFEFVADKPGTFTIYCKTCWDGPFGRGHPDIRATLVVNE